MTVLSRLGLVLGCLLSISVLSRIRIHALYEVSPWWTGHHPSLIAVLAFGYFVGIIAIFTLISVVRFIGELREEG